MTTLLLDKNNNLIFGNTFSEATHTLALAQDIRTRLSMWQGEYPFDTSEGVPYKDLLQQNNNEILKNEILAEVKKDERVSSAKITDFFLENGKLNLGIEIQSTQGETINV